MLVAHWKSIRILSNHTAAWAIAFSSSKNSGKRLIPSDCALSLKPDFAEAHTSLGLAPGRQGKIGEALVATAGHLN